MATLSKDDRLKYAKLIFEHISQAVEEGYYEMDDLEYINYVEIREWCDFQVDHYNLAPDDKGYDENDAWFDKTVENVASVIKSALYE